LCKISLIEKIRGNNLIYDGLVIGLISFLIIGIFHPIVIKGEYYFGIKIWPIFLILGITSCGISIMLGDIIFRSIFGIIGFTLLWSIGELFHQKERVKKGWFPKNPKRKYDE
jgi:hypothetical protein